ncbi:barstar family protein [Brevundimonas sp.]|uniref:barstar family protein n=1 Tax=Brevundimonas sp. TaxID=1871086 RepID=UPI0035AE7B65
MVLLLEIESSKIGSLDDVYDLVAKLPGLPDWFGRNINALAELAYFVKQPLDIVVRHPKALERRLGRRDYEALIWALEAVRDTSNKDAGSQPATLAIIP